MSGFQVLVQPTKEPITLTDAKTHSRIPLDYCSEDGYIQALITACRQSVESWISQSLITQTLLLSFDLFPVSPWNILWGSLYKTYNPIIELPQSPVQSVSSITYLDLGSGLRTAWTDYFLDTTTIPARVVPNWLSYYPIARPMPGSIQITYVAGYGNDASSVPVAARQAILELFATHYENRESVSAVQAKTVPHHIEYLLASVNSGQL